MAIRKPVLTERILRGILNIEECCGGMLERCEMRGQGMAASQHDDARTAQRWAREMLQYRGLPLACSCDDCAANHRVESREA